MKKISVPITVEYLCTGCSIYMCVYIVNLILVVVMLMDLELF